MRRVEKPWGWELWWAHTDRYVGKQIHINKGEALSLQYHNKKDEVIFVFRGRILFEMGDSPGVLQKREMAAGESVEDTYIFEVSTPEVEDVVRLEDRYGRTT
jgi:mannose-6-phosphate isomerase-like protein (cupin superfamily)